LGRSRGGLTTKLHAACPHENYATALLLTAGNVNDCSAFDPLYQAVEAENVLRQAAADKGYDSDAIRETLATDGIEPVIPPKSNRKQPLAYDRQTYRERNRVERFFNKLKHFRRIATRYDKFQATFTAFIHLASAFMAIRNS